MPSGIHIISSSSISEYKGPGMYICMKPWVLVHEEGDESPKMRLGGAELWTAGDTVVVIASSEGDDLLITCSPFAFLRPLFPTCSPWAQPIVGTQCTFAAHPQPPSQQLLIVRSGGHLNNGSDASD